MRRLLYVLGGTLGFLLLAAVSVPFLFRDKVDALLQQQINTALHAHFSYERLGLSLFRHFPALTVRLEGLTVINKAPFEGDTLLSCEALDLGVHLLKALRGEIEITRLYLFQPKIRVQVRPDGTASWDITVKDTIKTPQEEDTSASTFRLGLRRYEIQGGDIIYWDSSLQVYTRLVGLSHRGRGDFTQDEMLLETQTFLSQVFFSYGKVTYLKGQSLTAGVDLDINFPAGRYRLKRGEVRLNELPLSLSGMVSLPDTVSTLLDLKFSAPQASLKELLSLIPAVFLKGYESLSTEGILRLDGYVQGEMRDSLLPAFALRLAVERGQLRYKDLPKPIQDIELRLRVENLASTLESLRVYVDTLSLRAGSSFLRARLQSRGLSQIQLQGMATGKGDLSEFASALPLGYEVRGKFDMDLLLTGVYAENRLPSVQGRIQVQEGYIKAADFPTPLEKLQVDFVAESPEGLPSRTTATLKRFFAVVSGEPVEAAFHVQNLEALNYTLSAKGVVDLGTWTRLFPIENTRLSGKLTFDFLTQGNREALEKRDYSRLPTRGSLEIHHFRYESVDLPQGVTIEQARLAFSPQYAVLSGYKGAVGRSDIALEGRIENYLGYLFKEEKLVGSLALRSQRLDLNEWITSDTVKATSPPPTDTTSALEVVVLPANVDFTFQAEVGELLYERMRFQRARGKVIIRDQSLRLEGFQMEGLGGLFALSGMYHAPDKQNANWNMQFDLRSVKIEEVAAHFATLRRLAPIVRHTSGQVNLSLSAGSSLRPDFMPDLPTLSGKGVAEVIQATVQGSASLAALSAAAKMPQLNTLQLKNTLIKFKLQNGGLEVEPFSTSAGELRMEIGGITRLDQTISYLIGMEVPSGWGQGFLQAAGLSVPASATLRLVAELGGTVAAPKVIRVRPQEGGGSVREALVNRVEEEKARLEAEAKRKKDSVEALLRSKEDSIRKAIEQKRREEEERLRREAEERRRQEEERLRQEAERRKREEEERLRRQVEEEKRKKEEELKKKLPFPR
ncbi:MAG: AsmA family protein [Bacteroidia bacterium]|nr:AsmA family protein [Bacteroidia bacterium]